MSPHKCKKHSCCKSHCEKKKTCSKHSHTSIHEIKPVYILDPGCQNKNLTTAQMIPQEFLQTNVQNGPFMANSNNPLMQGNNQIGFTNGPIPVTLVPTPQFAPREFQRINYMTNETFLPAVGQQTPEVVLGSQSAPPPAPFNLHGEGIKTVGIPVCFLPQANPNPERPSRVESGIQAERKPYEEASEESLPRDTTFRRKERRYEPRYVRERPRERQSRLPHRRRVRISPHRSSSFKRRLSPKYSRISLISDDSLSSEDYLERPFNYGVRETDYPFPRRVTSVYPSMQDQHRLSERRGTVGGGPKRTVFSNSEEDKGHELEPPERDIGFNMSYGQPAAQDDLPKMRSEMRQRTAETDKRIDNLEKKIKELKECMCTASIHGSKDNEKSTQTELNTLTFEHIALIPADQFKQCNCSDSDKKKSVFPANIKQERTINDSRKPTYPPKKVCCIPPGSKVPRGKKAGGCTEFVDCPGMCQCGASDSNPDGATDESSVSIYCAQTYKNVFLPIDLVTITEDKGSRIDKAPSLDDTNQGWSPIFGNRQMDISKYEEVYSPYGKIFPTQPLGYLDLMNLYYSKKPLHFQRDNTAESFMTSKTLSINEKKKYTIYNDLLPLLKRNKTTGNCLRSIRLKIFNASLNKKSRRHYYVILGKLDSLKTTNRFKKWRDERQAHHCNPLKKLLNKNIWMKKFVSIDRTDDNCSTYATENLHCFSDTLFPCCSIGDDINQKKVKCNEKIESGIDEKSHTKSDSVKSINLDEVVNISKGVPFQRYEQGYRNIITPLKSASKENISSFQQNALFSNERIAAARGNSLVGEEKEEFPHYPTSNLLVYSVPNCKDQLYSNHAIRSQQCLFSRDSSPGNSRTSQYPTPEENGQVHRTYYAFDYDQDDSDPNCAGGMCKREEPRKGNSSCRCPYIRECHCSASIEKIVSCSCNDYYRPAPKSGIAYSRSLPGKYSKPGVRAGPSFHPNKGPARAQYSDESEPQLYSERRSPKDKHFQKSSPRDYNDPRSSRNAFSNTDYFPGWDVSTNTRHPNTATKPIQTIYDPEFSNIDKMYIKKKEDDDVSEWVCKRLPTNDDRRTQVPPGRHFSHRNTSTLAQRGSERGTSPYRPKVSDMGTYPVPQSTSYKNVQTPNKAAHEEEQQTSGNFVLIGCDSCGKTLPLRSDEKNFQIVCRDCTNITKRPTRKNIAVGNVSDSKLQQKDEEKSNSKESNMKCFDCQKLDDGSILCKKKPECESTTDALALSIEQEEFPANGKNRRQSAGKGVNGSVFVKDSGRGSKRTSIVSSPKPAKDAQSAKQEDSGQSTKTAINVSSEHETPLQQNKKMEKSQSLGQESKTEQLAGKGEESLSREEIDEESYEKHSSIAENRDPDATRKLEESHTKTTRRRTSPSSEFVQVDEKSSRKRSSKSKKDEHQTVNIVTIEQGPSTTPFAISKGVNSCSEIVVAESGRSYAGPGIFHERHLKEKSKPIESPQKDINIIRACLRRRRTVNTLPWKSQYKKQASRNTLLFKRRPDKGKQSISRNEDFVLNSKAQNVQILYQIRDNQNQNLHNYEVKQGYPIQKVCLSGCLSCTDGQHNIDKNHGSMKHNPMIIEKSGRDSEFSDERFIKSESSSDRNQSVDKMLKGNNKDNLVFGPKTLQLTCKSNSKDLGKYCLKKMKLQNQKKSIYVLVKPK